MGTFLTNLHVRLGDQDAVIDGVRRAKGLPACVSPVNSGWVSVFPQSTESQEQKVLVELAAEVARQTRAPVLAFLIHDSDIFRYVLHDVDVRDDYDSDPGYWDDPELPPSGGNAKLLTRYFTTKTSENEVETVLRKKLIDGEEVGFAEDLMYWLGGRLGIEGDFLANSWDYLQGDLPSGFIRIQT